MSDLDYVSNTGSMLWNKNIGDRPYQITLFKTIYGKIEHAATPYKKNIITNKMELYNDEYYTAHFTSEFGHVISLTCINIHNYDMNSYNSNKIILKYCNTVLLELTVDQIINIVRLDKILYEQMDILYTKTKILSLPLQQIIMNFDVLNLNSTNLSVNYYTYLHTLDNLYLSGTFYYLDKLEKQRYDYTSQKYYINSYYVLKIDNTNNTQKFNVSIYDMLCESSEENTKVIVSNCLDINKMTLYFNDCNNLSNNCVAFSSYTPSQKYKYLNCRMSNYNMQNMTPFHIIPNTGCFKYTTEFTFDEGLYIFRYIQSIYISDGKCNKDEYFCDNDLPLKQKILLQLKQSINDKTLDTVLNILNTQYNMNDLTYPLTDYFEGFWFSEKEQQFPIPLPSTNVISSEFLNKYKKVTEFLLKNNKKTEYFGSSSCRLCNNNCNGSSTYHLNYNEIVYNFPSGLIHYYEIHNVKLSKEFEEAIMNYEL